MELKQLKETKINKLDNALREVFGTSFNFNASTKKLKAVRESTARKIDALRESGVDVTSKQYQKLLLIAEGIDMTLKQRRINESPDLDTAEVLLAAKQMADDLQKIAENLASMQVEDLMSITNAMKEELGSAEAEAFSAAAEGAISSALEAVKAANEQVSNAVLVAQGQPVETDMDANMGAGPEMPADMGDDMEIDVDTDVEDDFGGADAAGAAGDETGREMKEDAYLKAVKMVKEAQRDGKVSKALLKQAFAQLKK
jgi:hypothetical protein